MNPNDMYNLSVTVHRAQYHTDLMAADLGFSDWTHGQNPNWAGAEASANIAIALLQQVLIKVKQEKEK